MEYKEKNNKKNNQTHFMPLKEEIECFLENTRFE